MTLDPLHELLVSELSRAWEEGNPVAGSTDAAWQRSASVIRRRWQSLARRDVSVDDHPAVIRDFVRSLIENFEPDPRLVGPLRLDYEYLARQLLTAILAHADESFQ